MILPFEAAGARRPVRVLLVDDDPDDQLLARELLGEIEEGSFEVRCASTYEGALREIRGGAHDVVLLDYRLGGRTGTELLEELAAEHRSAPVIMLTGQGDRAIDLEAMRAGAADYLVKGRIDAPLLERSIRYAMERHRLLAQIRAMSLTDELTGLYNRRGFFSLAEHQLRVADRTKRELALLFADLDGMKWINDQLGHTEGDRALRDTAALLRSTFRDSDIVARLGGDEFVVLAPGVAPAGVEAMARRLGAAVQALNADPGRVYTLSLSIGVTTWDPAAPATLDELLARADSLMYHHKQLRGAGRMAAAG
jgi:two-component system cell cycle response regulator